ncbi:hypothetical protein M7I_0069 [Glarea lozoyensis 74030]|uniref:Uncharacterized protein n=1 Tax=Glarea lozoyensis (strain ATCC 74030 / MF5533) TaxID=1104152 RepID=H0ECD5_GLAL7|nr:hypothetical protein M7I_0069 [Glarea lozoyensis 74030]
MRELNGVVRHKLKEQPESEDGDNLWREENSMIKFNLPRGRGHEAAQDEHITDVKKKN